MLAATSLAIAVSLSMDSFAAALGRGACQTKPCLPEAVRVGVVFGACQLAMPVIGWLIGASFADLVQTLDHWIAFGLLLFVGGSMIRNAFADEEPNCAQATMGWLPLFATGIATSIDACAVGIGLALAELDIVATATLIGVVTFLSAFGGVMLGRVAGPWLGRRAEIVGGLGLIAIGAKILIDHTLLSA